MPHGAVTATENDSRRDRQRQNPAVHQNDPEEEHFAKARDGENCASKKQSERGGVNIQPTQEI